MKHIKSVAAREAVNNISNEVAGIPWKKICPNASEEALELLSLMIKFDPDERIGAEEALKHPFFKEYNEFLDEDYPDITAKFN